MKILLKPVITKEEFYKKLSPELLELNVLLEELLGKISLTDMLEGKTKQYINGMNLSEQFLKASRIEGVVNNEEVIAATNATIAEKFAIQFAKWFRENYMDVGNSLYTRYGKFKNPDVWERVTIKEALKVFKNENIE